MIVYKIIVLNYKICYLIITYLTFYCILNYNLLIHKYLDLTRIVDTFVEVGGSVDVGLKIYGPLSINDVKQATFENHIVSEEVTLNTGKTTIDNNHNNNDMEDIKDTETSLSYTYRFTANAEGTYGFCLDNRQSRFTDKTTQIDIYSPSRVDPNYIMLQSLLLLGNDAGHGDSVIGSKEMNGYDQTDHGAKDPSSSSSSSGSNNIGKGDDLVKDKAEIKAKVKNMLEVLQNGLSKIQYQQQRDRRRLAYHDKNNSDTDRRVVMSSLVETAFFIGASLFQIFFVRRWFQGRQTVSHRV